MKEWLKNLWVKVKAYIRIDGVLHFGVCYAIVVTLGLIDWFAGVIVAFGLSILKEEWDYACRDKMRGWDWKHTGHDLLFDFLGIIFGILICLWLK